jgi:adenosylhomocysteine nucleosidase
MPDGSPGLSATGPCRMLLLAALPWEVRPFLRRNRCRRRRAGVEGPAWELAVGPGWGLLALTGLGAEAARRAASRLVSHLRPRLLLSLGFGGAVSPELRPGDLVLGEYFGSYDPLTRLLQPVAAPPPPRPLPELLRALAAAGPPTFAGSIITTPRIIRKSGLGEALAWLRRPVLDLETAAVAEVARAEGLPFLGLRAITDAAAEEITEFLARPQPNTGTPGWMDALGWLAGDPRRMADLLHLWRRSQLAAARLAQALQVLLPQLAGAGQELEGQPG